MPTKMSGRNQPPALLPNPRILLVDDDESIRTLYSLALTQQGFEVVTASTVKDAIQLITTQVFDVLLSDLHMPGAGDGLTVVSAMRHSNPKAVTLIFSGHPEMKEATAAILLQADQIIVKPMSVNLLADTIRERLKEIKAPARVVKSVATILQLETKSTINDWLHRVEAEPQIFSIPMDSAERSAHLPALFANLITRLRHPLPLGTRALASIAAVAHGLKRREQGYTAAMMVEESRMLQVSIFQTLQHQLASVDFSLLLTDIMAIADEVDSQLAQAMSSYVNESNLDARPVTA